MKLSTQFIIAGLVLGLGGVLALANPFAASLTVTTIVGVLLILSGIFQLWAAFSGIAMARGFTGFMGLLALVAGVFLLASPMEGVLSLTFVVGLIFLVSGLTRLFLAWQLRQAGPFWVLLLSGAASVVLGAIIFAADPVDAAALLGLLFGFELLADGVGLVALGILGRNMWK